MPSWKKIIVSGSNVSQLNNDSGYARTGSANTFYADQTINGNLVVTGSITALQYIISSSVIYITSSNFSGSNVFGNTMDDTHQFTGSVYITGSLKSPSITGSLFGTASWAVSASRAINALNAVSSSISLTSNQIRVSNPEGTLGSEGYISFTQANPGAGFTSPEYLYLTSTLRYNFSSNVLTLSKGLLGAPAPRLNIGDTSGYGQVFISGSTNLYRSGSTILSISGSLGSIMEVTDELKTNILQVDNGSNTLFTVDTTPGVSLSGSIRLFGLTNTAKTHVLTYDTTTYEVFYTASSAIGGGGSTTPGGANTTIQFNDSTVFSGSANYTFTKASNLVQLTGSFVVSGSTPMLVIGTSVVTGSLAVTGSILLNGSPISQPKAGSGSAASFSGSPVTSAILFGTAFNNNSYAVTVTGEDARSLTIQSKTSAGFTINTNSSVALTSPVYWIATPFNS